MGHVVVHVPVPTPALWALVEPLLAPSIARADGDTVESVGEAVLQGHAHLWMIADKAALVTRLIVTKDGPALEYWHLGGTDARSWFGEMVETIESEARRIGCVKAVAACRLGWKRLAKDYRPVAVMIEKRL